MPRSIRFLVGCVVLMTLFGAYDALVADTPALDLQAEPKDGLALPAMFSGALLLGVAWLSVELARRPDRAPAARWVWGLFSLLFLEAAVDETVTIHERLGESTGVDWLVLYSPLFAAAGILWVTVLRALEGSPERRLWLGGAGAWVLAQTLELYAYGGTEQGRPGAGAFSAAEELLEMTGSLLLLWTLLEVWQRVRPAREPAARPARTRRTLAPASGMPGPGDAQAQSRFSYDAQRPPAGRGGAAPAPRTDPVASAAPRPQRD
jgi:hypothetical protein